MKKLVFALPAILLLFAFVNGTNMNKQLPEASLKKMDGTVLASKDLFKTGKPAVISFWSTTCVPCIKELIAINKKYDAWKKETGAEVYAISTDDERFVARVPVIVKKKGWKFPVLLDTSKDLFKKLGATNNPYTIVVDGTGKIVYEHSSYKAGDEEEIYKVLKSLK